MCYSYVAIVFTISLSIGAGRVTAGEPPLEHVNYEKVADGAPWSWRQDEAGPMATLGASPDYDGSILMRHGRSGIEISILKDGKVLYSWSGHRFSVFRIVGNRLFLADFNPNDSGGTIIAVDLLNGKRMWKSALLALGPVQHSAYANFMNLRANSEVVEVYGNEGAGRYFEIKDAATGRTVGHKIFPKERGQMQ